MTGPPATPASGHSDRTARNGKVVQLRDEGLMWPEVAPRLGCSDRTARRGQEQFLRTVSIATVEDVDADRIVGRVLRSHLAALDRRERLAVRSDNSNAMVGAARSLASVSVSLLDVLARLGLLGDPGLYRFQNELWIAAAAVVSLAEEYDTGMLEALDRVRKTAA